jgi:hypothetical protein
MEKLIWYINTSNSLQKCRRRHQQKNNFYELPFMELFLFPNLLACQIILPSVL